MDSFGRLLQRVCDGGNLAKSHVRHIPDGVCSQQYVLVFNLAGAYDTGPLTPEDSSDGAGDPAVLLHLDLAVPERLMCAGGGSERHQRRPFFFSKIHRHP